MVNKVILVGRLGRDPELRRTQSGKAVANFSLATDSQGSTEWHRIVVWDRLAEICDQYLHKGKQVYIEGRIQTREWDDRDGNKRYTTEIVAYTMQMLGSRDDDFRSETAHEAVESGGAEQEEKEDKMETVKVGITDDDIPF